MEEKPGKRKRRRIKKTRIKQPTSFELKMAVFFGPEYLEKKFQVHVGIILFLVLVISLIVILIMTASPKVENPLELDPDFGR